MRRPTHPTDTSEPERSQVLDALKQVLESEKFAAAPQMSAFLRYVVEQTINGNRKRIKAYTVAVEALGKPDAFDPQNDPVVRVLAGRLRASLTAYYDGRPDADIQILMKPGSYAPQFITRSPTTDDVKSAESNTDEAALSARQYPSTRVGVLSEKIGSSDQASNAESGMSTLNSFLRSSLRFPSVGLSIFSIAVAVVFITKSFVQDRSAAHLASAEHALIQSSLSAATRQRPDQVSLFVDITDSGKSLTEQLNTIISGVFLESSDIRVYRRLPDSTVNPYWPEDYLVSLDVMPLTTETRVNIQLINAQSGRISHSTSLTLESNVAESMTRGDFATVTRFARELVTEDGPLLRDYEQKKNTDKRSGN